MRIEIQAPEVILQEFGLRLHDELLKAGFSEGPKVHSADHKVVGYTKGDAILNVEISHESESREPRLTVESEAEVPEFQNIWDAALIDCGRNFIARLKSFAIDKEKVKKEF